MKCALLVGFALAASVLAQGLPPAAMAVEVRITDAKGAAIQNARVQVLAVLSGSKHFRNVPGQAPRDLGPKDFRGGWALVGGLPAGEFVLRVDAGECALTLSSPFQLPADSPPHLTVRMLRGATIEGVVTTPDGKPLAGAEVRTEGVGPRDSRDPVALILAQLRAETTTAASARTAADGTFRIEHVARGDYRVVVQHFAFAPGEQPVAIKDEGTKKLPPVAVAEGAMLSGAVTRGGRPAAGVEVLVQSEPGESGPGKQPLVAVRLTANTDAEGRYRMPARVPLGRHYALSAATNAPPLEKMAEAQATRRLIAVRVGTESQVEDLKLPLK